MNIVNIKGRVYEIHYVDKVDNQNNLGECDKNKKIIRIKRSLNEAERQATLIHELFHAVLHEIYADALISDDLEEIIVENLSTYILDYLKDLCDKEKEEEEVKKKKKRKK